MTEKTYYKLIDKYLRVDRDLGTSICTKMNYASKALTKDNASFHFNISSNLYMAIKPVYDMAYIDVTSDISHVSEFRVEPTINMLDLIVEFKECCNLMYLHRFFENDVDSISNVRIKGVYDLILSTREEFILYDSDLDGKPMDERVTIDSLKLDDVLSIECIGNFVINNMSVHNCEQFTIRLEEGDSIYSPLSGVTINVDDTVHKIIIVSMWDLENYKSETKEYLIGDKSEYILPYNIKIRREKKEDV